MQITRTKEYFFAVLSGCLLSVPFLIESVAPLLYVAFIPLLFAENVIQNQAVPDRWKIVNISLLSFFIFNALSLWWIAKASFNGYLLTCFVGSFAMSISFIAYSKMKSFFPVRLRGILFLCTWISYEYLQYHWEFSFPWLNLGNAFAFNKSLIQWYEYTGILGGTLLVVIVNYALFVVLQSKFALKYAAAVLMIAAAIVLPFLLSNHLIRYVEKTDDEIHCIAVQPNINPYTEKFLMPVKSQVNKMLSVLSETMLLEESLVVFPETALYDTIDQDNVFNNVYLQYIKSRLHGTPFIVGVTSYKFYKNYNKPALGKHDKFGRYYHLYNSALYAALDTVQLIHKNKRVPGVEKIPFSQYFPFLENIAIDIGGGLGTIAYNETFSCFNIPSLNCSVAVAICYESLYGAYVSQKVRSGAHLIAIITNDGWWGNTQGYKYHNAMASLRAIETRRWIVRSANNGISSIIDHRGDVLASSIYGIDAIVASNVGVCKSITFYAQYGDIIGILCAICLFLLICYNITRFYLLKK